MVDWHLRQMSSLVVCNVFKFNKYPKLIYKKAKMKVVVMHMPTYLVINDSIASQAVGCCDVKPLYSLLCSLLKVNIFKYSQVILYLFVRLGAGQLFVKVLQVWVGAVAKFLSYMTWETKKQYCESIFEGTKVCVFFLKTPLFVGLSVHGLCHEPFY